MAEHGDDMQDMIPPPIPENADGVPDEGSLGPGGEDLTGPSSPRSSEPDPSMMGGETGWPTSWGTRAAGDEREPGDGQEIDRFIEECRLSSESHPLSDLKLPWESEAFGSIFSGPSHGLRISVEALLDNNLVGPDDVPRLEQPPGRAPIYMDAIALASRRTRHLTGADQWKAAVCKWTMAVSQDLSASSVGQELLFLQPEERLAYMGQVLGGKATSTLSKRVGQVARYYRWRDVARLDYFPITRAKVHGYVDAIREGRGALGRVKGFLEVLEACPRLRHSVG